MSYSLKEYSTTYGTFRISGVAHSNIEQHSYKKELLEFKSLIFNRHMVHPEYRENHIVCFDINYK
jgi:hypothetical protein